MRSVSELEMSLVYGGDGGGSLDFPIPVSTTIRPGFLDQRTTRRHKNSKARLRLSANCILQMPVISSLGLHLLAVSYSPSLLPQLLAALLQLQL
jgi:hypothetical protein